MKRCARNSILTRADIMPHEPQTNSRRFTKLSFVLAIAGGLALLAPVAACARHEAPAGIVQSHGGMVVSVSDPASRARRGRTATPRASTASCAMNC